MTAPRWIALEGAFNVRDLGDLEAGGRRTRRGVLLRADNLDNLTLADVRTLVDKHRLRAVVDLRNCIESPDPPAWIAEATIERLNVPLFDLSGETTAAVGEHLRRDVGSGYRHMLEMAGPAIAHVLAVIADESRQGGSVVVHCAAGKDRTGIVVAVLLRAVGVSEDLVIADYLDTAERIEAVRTSLARRGVYRPPAGAGPLPAMTAEPIEAVLAALRAEPGGVVGFLTRHGVPPEQGERFSELLLTPR